MSGGNLLLLATAACVGVLVILLFRASARLAFVAWGLVLFFVPVWVGATAGFFWSAVTAVTLMAVVSCIGDMRLSVIDAIMASFIVLIVALFALKSASLSATVIALLEWVLPYLWGRIVLTRVPKAFVTDVLATLATAVALLALIEFATGSNIFTLLPPMSAELFAEWAPLQERGGMLRVEGAFGHSIAFGAALAMSSVFVLAARWPMLVRIVALVVITSATVATFSRIGLITLALTIALSVVFLPGISVRVKAGIALVGAVAAAVILPIVSGVFLEAGDEASGSADYRGGLFALISQVRVLGAAGDWTGLTVGGDYLGAYANSVDNAFLVFALRFGWIGALALTLVLVLAALSGISTKRGTPPSIAVAAQLPTLFVVALITQFGMYLWFLAGLAVAWRLMERREPAEVFRVPQAVDRGARR